MKGIGMKMFSGYSVAAAMLAAATLAGCPAPELHTQVLTNPNTIDGKQLYFIPTDTEKRAGDQFYSRTVVTENSEGLPFLEVQDTSGHTAIDFTNGDPAQIDLSEPVFYYGALYSTLFVGSDGTIGFGVAGGGNDTLANHFAHPQISLLPVDATLAGSDVTWAEFGDSVFITFENITIAEVTGNSFQAEFRKTRGIDGDIALTYPVVTPLATGIVGLSNGQLEGLTADQQATFLNGFVNSNLNQDSANTSSAKLGS